MTLENELVERTPWFYYHSIRATKVTGYFPPLSLRHKLIQRFGGCNLLLSLSPMGDNIMTNNSTFAHFRK